MSKKKKKQGSSQPSESSESASSLTFDNTVDDASSESVANSEMTSHREATLDFADLKADATVGEVEAAADAVEEENLATEGPLDKYIRKHREEVEGVKSSFGQDIDDLVKKERAMVAATDAAALTATDERDKTETEYRQSDPDEAVAPTQPDAAQSEVLMAVEPTDQELASTDQDAVASPVEPTDSESAAPATASTDPEAVATDQDAVASSVEPTDSESAAPATASTDPEPVATDQAEATPAVEPTDQESVAPAVEPTNPESAAPATASTDPESVATDQAEATPAVAPANSESATPAAVAPSDASESAETIESPAVEDATANHATTDNATEEPELLDGELISAQHRVIFPLPLAADRLTEDSAEASTESATPADSAPSDAAPASTAPNKFDTVAIVPLETPVELPGQSTSASTESAATASSQSSSDSASSASPTKKSYKKALIAGVAAVAVVAAAGGTFALVKGSQQHHAETRAVQKTAQANLTKFKTAYAAFYTDSSQTALKNSAFSRLPALKRDFDALSPNNTSGYATYRTRYTRLTHDISAIQQVNALFDKPAIVDGKLDTTAKVKDGATLPAVSSENKTLNALLQQALTQAKNQQSSAASSSAAASSAAASSASASATSPSGPAGPSSPAGNGSTTAQNPSGQTPNNSNSRVPVQSINPNDPAFAWSPGVLEHVVSLLQSRGNISGSDYILQPVAIATNGQGWYNLYRPDGTYLVSINCKTGYFVGNGAGHSDGMPDSF